MMSMQHQLARPACCREGPGEARPVLATFVWQTLQRICQSAWSPKAASDPVNACAVLSLQGAIHSGWRVRRLHPVSHLHSRPSLP